MDSDFTFEVINLHEEECEMSIEVNSSFYGDAELCAVLKRGDFEAKGSVTVSLAELESLMALLTNFINAKRGD